VLARALGSIRMDGLGRPRLRPRADKGVSRTNASSVAGGLFGREPAAYRTISGGDDFLAKLEVAEARDDYHRRQPAPSVDFTLASLNEQQQHRMRARQKHWNGSIFLGDDSTGQRSTAPASMYQTTNSENQLRMQEMHQNALTRQQEKTLIKIMVDQHGLTESEAKHEIALYNKEVAQEQAQAFAAPKPPAQRGYAAGRSLQRGQHAPPPPPPPPLQQEPHFGLKPHFNSRNDVAAGAPRSVTDVHSGDVDRMVMRERPAPGRFDANRSSVQGGLFAQGVSLF